MAGTRAIRPIELVDEQRGRQRPAVAEVAPQLCGQNNGRFGNHFAESVKLHSQNLLLGLKSIPEQQREFQRV